ncbi:10511_t:CDS:2, partial [Funneliformis mosseae]
FRPDLNISLICPECRNSQANLIEEYSSGDIVCGDCGLVLADRIIDTRSEWRTYNGGDNDPPRVGAAADPLLKDSALNKIISSKGRKGLTRTHIKATTSEFDMTLKHAFSEIEALCGLKKLRDLLELSKRTDDLSLLSGRNQNTFAAVGIPIDNIAKVSGMVLGSIKSVYRFLHAKRESFQDIIDNKERVMSPRKIASLNLIQLPNFHLANLLITPFLLNPARESKSRKTGQTEIRGPYY